MTGIARAASDSINGFAMRRGVTRPSSNIQARDAGGGNQWMCAMRTNP